MTSTNKRAPCNVIFKDKMAARLSNGRFVGKGKKRRTAALLSSKRMSSHKENENSDEIIKTPPKCNGNRIIDLSEIINQLAKGCNDCEEELTLTRMTHDTKSGLGSYLYILCSCGTINSIFSGSTHYDKSKKQRRKIFDINTNTVNGKTTKYYRVAFMD